MAQSNGKLVWIIIIAAVVVIVGYLMLSTPDTRTTSEKMGDAVEELQNGAGDAMDELRDRTPAERLGDAVEDAGDDVQDAIDDANDEVPAPAAE